MREREREKEGEVGEREKHRSVVSCTYPDRGTNPQPFGIWDDAPTN